jgi:hypothetical protein
MKKHILAYLLVGVTCAAIGYLTGTERGYHLGSKSSQGGSLNWLCKVHEQLQGDHPAQATQITEAAISAHLLSLSALEETTSVDYSPYVAEASSYILASGIKFDSGESTTFLSNHNQKR